MKAAEEGGGGEAGGLWGSEMRGGDDRAEQEAEDQQIESIHSVAEGGAPECLLGWGNRICGVVGGFFEIRDLGHYRAGNAR